MHPADGRMVSNFTVQALRDEPITVFRDGTQTRSLCHVDELIDALVRFLETPGDVTEPMTLGKPHELSLAQFANRIIAVTISRSELSLLPSPDNDPRQRQPDIGYAERVLQWEPSVSLDAGLTKTIEHLRTVVQPAGDPMDCGLTTTR